MENLIPSFFDPVDLVVGVAFAALLFLPCWVFLSFLSDGLDAIAPLPASKNPVPKEAPRQLDAAGVCGPDGRAHFVVANARRWPRFRQRILLRIDDESAAWVWVTAYTATDGSKRFDYNLND